MEGCRLILGDCLEVLPTLEADSIDAVVTDPPYCTVNRLSTPKRLGLQRKRDGSTRRLQFDWDVPGAAEMVAEALGQALAKCKPAAALFVFCGIDIVGDLLPVARRAGFIVKPAAWVKKYPPPAGHGNWWPSAFELAFYGYRKGPWFGDTDPKRSNVFVADSYRHGQPGKVPHPTQKPLGLTRRIVRSIAPPGGTVLDPFAGSGTTGLACLQTGRQFIGIEKEPAYIEIARGRLVEAEGPLFAAPESCGG